MSADGYILTNRHVIEGATNVEVTLHNGAVYPIKGSWMDDTMDLAVLKINGANLPNLNFADPNTAKVGDCVLAVGHAFGLSPREGGASVTFGVISNLNRTLSLGDTTNYDVIQTDAAINPGNSGGPLVNMAGEVIGINSAYVVSAQNTAFAINVGTAAHVFTDLVKFGQPHHPYLGVVLMDTMPPRVGQIRMLQKSGALVTNVEQAQPAYLAAVRKGDIITNFAGQQIDSAAGLLRELWRHEVGEKVPIVYVRSGIAMQAEVTLADRHKSGFV